MSSTSSTFDTSPPARLPGWHALLRAGLCGALLLSGARALGAFDAGAAVLSLPGLCLFHGLTGLDCPGCGMTRAFVALARGDLGAAEALHPFSGPLLAFLVVLALLPRERALELVRGRAAHAAGAGALVVLLAWWAAKLLQHWGAGAGR